MIDSVVDKTAHTVGILPTGYGKSMTYVLPPLLVDGFSLVIRLLRSPMMSQAKQLKERGFKCISDFRNGRFRQMVCYYSILFYLRFKYCVMYTYKFVNKQVREVRARSEFLDQVRSPITTLYIKSGTNYYYIWQVLVIKYYHC